MTVEKAGDDAVLDAVFSSGRDRGADSAAPEPKEEAPKTQEPEKASEPQETAEKGDTDGSSQKQYRDPETGRFVPLHELKSEREKRQTEAKEKEEARKQAAEWESRYKDLERRLMEQPRVQQQPPQPQQPQADWWTDPESAAVEMQRRQDLAMFETRVVLAEEIYKQKPDYEQTKAAFVAAAQRDPTLAEKFYRARNPVSFAYDLGKKLLVSNEIGDNPEAYRERVRAEEREKVLAEMKQNTTVNPQPQRFPGTLADATATGAQGAILSDEAVAGQVFGSSRRSRR